MAGRNVFITGSAGVGKSFTLSKIMMALMEKTGGRVVVTAPTGLAAILVGGCTVYAAFSIHPEMVKHRKFKKLPEAWRDIDVLIIDEVSMLHPDLFSFMDMQAQKARENEEPFGGVQLILMGDFFQLPPVHKNRHPDDPEFVFETASWCSLDVKTVELTKVHRQRDQAFIGMLERIRRGVPTVEDCQVITTLGPKNKKKRKRVQEAVLDHDDDDDEEAKVANVGNEPKEIKPTRLYCRNVQVDKQNKQELRKIPGSVYRYVLHVEIDSAGRELSVDQKKRLCDGLLKKSSFVEILELKVGAQVMLTANLSIADGLCNGARGVVVGFTEQHYPIVRFAHISECVIHTHKREVQVGRKQTAEIYSIPLRLGWAMTVHKCQGQSIDAVDVDLKGAFESGQVYTALSRATSMEGLTVRNFERAKVKAHPKVVAFYASLSK